MKLMQIHLKIALVLVFGIQCARAYRKYYIEDECISQKRQQEINFELPASGPDSVGEIKSNRFGTYSRTGRNCLFKLIPPKGYGIVITVLKIDFRSPDECNDYIKIFDGKDDVEKLCQYQEVGLNGKTYFSEDDIKILYHTSGDGMGFNNGIRLIFTVTKPDAELGSCSAPSEFRCDNARCIWAGVTCDGINNCGDASDEHSAEHPHCPEVTPVAIAAVVLGITTFIAIVVAMCLCCCRAQSDRPQKPPLIEDFPVRPNGGYIPLPGYSYGAVEHTIGHLQPVHSPYSAYPSAPMEYNPRQQYNLRQQYSPRQPSCHIRGGIPSVTQKVEIRYDKPPQYEA
ncbi:abnormal cell migration protein 13-like isoform X2 [Uloborus diversus]|uniref:abnormal cell migration protein 13-like isoform X2 n=1 Tax=Uloborus diversus TaxID=327109 RepID=UPI002408FBE1|nr:abnormal cell migration protein 13-like isoform X2 [Uloborus diversus]